LNFNKAIELDEAPALAYNNRGFALMERKLFHQALLDYHQAIALSPSYAQAYFNRGFAFRSLNRLDLALIDYDKAIELTPDDSAVKLNKAIALLLKGEFSTGWPLYESRWGDAQAARLQSREWSAPLWLGDQPLEGKTILLYAEQGFGDTIQFSRYAKWVANRGAKVILEVQPALVKLLAPIEGVDQIATLGEALPHFDYRCPLLSLPLVFNTDLQTIPPGPTQLGIDQERTNQWQSILGEKRQPRIGLTWSGSPTHKNDRSRSVGLAKLLSFLPDNYEYISLQKEVNDRDRLFLSKSEKIQHFGEHLEDFSDTASLIQLIDVVISIDTSVAHLAATLQKPTWVLLAHSPDWRWLLDRKDSPWYPSVTLFRQEAVGDWNLVFNQITGALNAKSEC
jgi:hypothetical protein